MSKLKVGLFYRDGGNYKCCFDVEIDKKIIDDLDLDMDNDIDVKYRSENLYEIEDLGLTTNDIPMIAECGFNVEYDHNYVSITSIGDIDE